MAAGLNRAIGNGCLRQRRLSFTYKLPLSIGNESADVATSFGI